MKARVLVFIVVLILAVSACNLPARVRAGTPTPLAMTPTPTLFLSTSAPTLTALPSNTPLPTATATPTVPVAFPREQAVNCRLGPGTGWIALSGLSLGVSSQIVGRSGDGGWWYIVDPFNSGRKCWVASSVTNTAGNLAGIPVVEAPEAVVTNVTVDVDPKTINAAACPGAGAPIEFSGSIETNGPTTVTWHFETQQSGPLTTQSTDFATFGSLEFSTNYTPLLGAGTYWVRLIVTSPNNIEAEAKYTITCP